MNWIASRATRATVTAAAAGALVAAAVLGPDGAFASSPTSARALTTSLHYTAHLDKQASVDVPPEGPSPSPGDQQVVAGTLWQGTTQVGRFVFICEIVTGGPNANKECSATGRVPDGTFTLEGFSRRSDEVHTWAVVGGTGMYRSARGQAEIHDHGKTAEVTIELG